jgi:hypothetical protein
MPGADDSLNVDIVASVIVVFFVFWDIDIIADVDITRFGVEVGCRVRERRLVGGLAAVIVQHGRAPGGSNLIGLRGGSCASPSNRSRSRDRALPRAKRETSESAYLSEAVFV